MTVHSLTYRPQVHGHRGCRGLFPENTIPAFLHAIKLGVDAIEMDVVLSADQQVVVAHEPWLSAKLGLSPIGEIIAPAQERKLNIYRLPYQAIRESIVGTLPHPNFPEQQILPTFRPLLREVLEASEAACQQLGRPWLQYSIEIKSTPKTEGLYHPGPDAFVAAVLSSIPSGLLPRTTLLCFDPRILQVVRRLHPSLRVCLLVEQAFTAATLFNGLGFVPNVFGPDYRLLTGVLINQLRTQYQSLEIVPWTINEPADIAQAIEWKVAGITTDYPNRVLQIL